MVDSYTSVEIEKVQFLTTLVEGSTERRYLVFTKPNGEPLVIPLVPEDINQEVLDALALKSSTLNPTFVGSVTLPGDPATALQAATKQFTENQASSGRYLARAINDAQETITVTEDDYLGLLISFTVGSRPVEVVLDIPLVLATAAAATAQFKITDQAGVVANSGRAIAFAKSDVANGYQSARTSAWFDAGAGAKILKCRRIFAGTGSVVANLSSLNTATLTAYER